MKRRYYFIFSLDAICIMRREWIFLILAGVILLLFGSIGTQLYVYVNFLLGHDISVSFSVTPQDVWLSDGENTTAKVVATVTTNPFCSAECALSFETNENLVLNETQTILPAIPFRASFLLTSRKYGSGTQVYRAHLACKSSSSLLCRTEGIITTRTVLVTLHYSPTRADQQRIGELSEKFSEENKKFNTLQRSAKSLSAIIENASFLSFTNNSENITLLLTEINNTLVETKRLWETQDLLLLNKQEQALQTRMAAAQEALRNWNESVTHDLKRYYVLLEKLNNTFSAVNEVQRSLFINEDFWMHANNTIVDIGTRISVVAQAQSFSDREAAILSAEALSVALNNSVRASIQEEISRRIKNAQEFERMFCVENCSILVQNVTLLDACSFVERVRERWENSSKINNTQLNNSLNNTNVTLFVPCVVVNITLVSVIRPVFPEINLEMREQEGEVIQNWDIPASQCCSKGECKKCCSECEQLYPIVFLHGHAFNKALSFEYSLDAFSKIQSLLEHDGILEAGAVTMYTAQNHSWKELPFPVSIKASYYVDQFQESENYIVQANSENIETYAVRLKELIERISSLTGRKKVILITHSMGGLVARRYLQLFGSSNVKGLIMIGPPTNGLQDTFAVFCPISGNERECDDLRTGSVFLRKLATAPIIVPTTVIAGSGCDTGGNNGDGVIQLKDTLLQGSKTIIINGTCTNRYPLHTTMLDTDIHPEVYPAIKEEIQIFAKSEDAEHSISER